MNNMQALKTNLPEDIALLKAWGDFDKAAELIKKYLTRPIPKALAERLTLELSILAELPMQYPYPYDEALKMMQEKVPGFTREDLETLKDDGYADWIYVNGVVHFQDMFVASIAKTVPKYKDIEVDEDQKTIEVSPVEILDETVNEMIEKGEKNYFIHIRHTVKIKKEAEELGNRIRVYLPIPQNADQISNIKLIDISPEPVKIADETYGQRTVYFEKPLEAGDTFTVEYSYENHAKYVKLDPDKVDAEQPDFETQELLPHIAFSPYIRALCEELTGGETNPLIKARKIYDFITTRVHYSYVREYLTITNIPDYMATGLKGDCGIQALLFITLCRCAASRPSGSLAPMSIRPASATTTGPCSTSRPMAGCTVTAPLGAAPTETEPKTAGISISAIWSPSVWPPIPNSSWTLIRRKPTCGPTPMTTSAASANTKTAALPSMILTRNV